MRKLLLASLLALACASPTLAAPVPERPAVDDSSSVESDGRRVLQESIIINAPREAAWKAFATTEGLLAWEAPVAAIDLKVDGFLEASYDPKARIGDPGNIRHTIIGYLPGRMLMFRNTQTPPGFKHADLFGQVVSIIEFEDAGPGRTKVTVSGVGYGSGADWDELYTFFRNGNAFVLEMLKAHLEGGKGPTGPVH